MSDFMPQNTLLELWDEIVRLHWIYLDTEESLVKLENRKHLEDCLKEFLCVVQHDRKFFLPETSRLLKKSIKDLDNFNAQKAITAFESINQYANNLFTKPWRKEFRFLKMYSGFYQHEIQSNLLDAEILFEAMGYRLLSENTLILDGPICPDQVTNVSRDALTAYVELQIIKQIYTGLDALGLHCSWIDIYNYREKNTGGTSQAIKELAFFIDEERFRIRQTTVLRDSYGYNDVQTSPNYYPTNNQFCPAQCQCILYRKVPSASKLRPIPHLSDSWCATGHQQQISKHISNLVCSNMAYPAHYQHNHHHDHHRGMSNDSPMPQMSHSRSLDHYIEPGNHHNVFLHRHSFDHQQQGCTAHHRYHHLQQLPQQQQCQHINQLEQNVYETPYDCIDGNSVGGNSSTISYGTAAANAPPAATTGGGCGIVGVKCNLNSSTTYSHPYNVSGNRFPLPLNISKQFSAYDNLQTSNYNAHPHPEPTYAHIAEQHIYSSVSKLPQNCMNTNATSHIHDLQNHLVVMKDSLQAQRSFQSEQLINFENPAILPPMTLKQQFDHSQYHQNCETSNQLMDNYCNIHNIMENTLSSSATSTCQQHCISGKSIANDDKYAYAKPTLRKNHKHRDNASSLPKYPYNCVEQGDRTELNYESANDDFNNLTCQANERNRLSSPTQFAKNQDGVGSSEHWKYVFQKLEKNNYSKDPGEREDFLIQSLDLDSLNITKDMSSSQSSSTEKRKSIYSGNEKKPTIQHQHKEAKQKSKTFENSKIVPQNTTSSTNNIEKQSATIDNNARRIKSAPKQIIATTKTNTNKPKPKTNDNKELSKTMNNNNNDSLTKREANGTMQRKKPSSSVVITSKKISSFSSTSAPPLSSNEWSCSVCTFLNSNKTRVCEMCCHSKDFSLDSSTNSTNAGGTTVTHNTPTCA